ncbi:MAG: NAD-dependent epimerase/dehydratase family protein [Chromatiales bacterium]|jgi:GDP-4-dehydro-6-deoxy-D-mannose reductase
MRALLTGASGFVGGYLTEFLQQQGIEVFSIGRTAIDGVHNYKCADLMDKNGFGDILSDIQPDYFFHLAGTTRAPDFQQALKVNASFGANLLDAIAVTGLTGKTRCLFYGSAAEYGLVPKEDLPLSESHCCQPYSHYGISKLAQTQNALAWATTTGRAVVVRPFTILGKGMPVSMAIGSFAEQISSIAASGGHGKLQTGNLDVSRDFIDVRDAVEISWRLVNNEQAYGQVINLCSGKATGLRKIVDYMIELSGSDIDIEYSLDRIRSIDMQFHYGDNRRLMNAIGDYSFTQWQVSVQQMLGQA